MFKSIVRAVVTALRAAVRFAVSVLSTPGRLADGLLGAAAPPPAGDSGMVEDLRDKLARDQADQENYRKIADAIWAWATDSLIEGKPAPVPVWLPRSVKEWLPGLTQDEAEKLVSADKMAIQAHLRGIYVLPSVRKVGPLIPVGNSWSAPEPSQTMQAPEPTFLMEAIAPPRLAS
jgi:hypothetical protein